MAFLEELVARKEAEEHESKLVGSWSVRRPRRMFFLGGGSGFLQRGEAPIVQLAENSAFFFFHTGFSLENQSNAPLEVSHQKGYPALPGKPL